jgi:hypothetical protein
VKARVPRVEGTALGVPAQQELGHSAEGSGHEQHDQPT